MTSTITRGVHLVTAVGIALLAIPVFGVLVWGAWRLLFWAVVDASPNVRHVHPTGMPVPGPMPPGTDSMLAGGGASLFGFDLLLTGVVLFTLAGLAVVVYVAISLAIRRDLGDDVHTRDDTLSRL